MPELRQNFFTKEWVVIATERAKRPEQLIVHRPHRAIQNFAEARFRKRRADRDPVDRLPQHALRHHLVA